ncbi:PREDICTED: esterase [Prunus dulcis]|uniref:PREDICTED: esterase n=1 Tax=Prunus dulcis TaxID=3755 RepID=A0A5E4ELJ3_PRUDU|nr:PREDICTED: esterase [Prunus dulcis]
MMISQFRWSAAVHIERGRFPHDVVPVNNNCLEPSPFKFSHQATQIQCTFHSSHTSGTEKKKKKKKLIHPLAYSSSYYYYRKTPEKLRNYMGSQGSEEGGSLLKKPRFLCLHGFRTSGEIMKKQVGKWPESVLQKLDLVYLDGPFPALGKSDVEGIFDPPYYEWFQFNKEFSEYTNFDKCLEYIEDYIIKQGPFDGLVGFSQVFILPLLKSFYGFFFHESRAEIRICDPF